MRTFIAALGSAAALAGAVVTATPALAAAPATCSNALPAVSSTREALTPDQVAAREAALVQLGMLQGQFCPQFVQRIAFSGDSVTLTLRDASFADAEAVSALFEGHGFEVHFA